MVFPTNLIDKLSGYMSVDAYNELLYCNANIFLSHHPMPQKRSSVREESIGFSLWKGIIVLFPCSCQRYFTFQERYWGQKSIYPYSPSLPTGWVNQKTKSQSAQIKNWNRNWLIKPPDNVILVNHGDTAVFTYNKEMQKNNTNILLYLLAGLYAHHTQQCALNQSWLAEMKLKRE